MWQPGLMFTRELLRICTLVWPSITPVKFLILQNSNRGVLKRQLHFHQKKKPMRLKPTWRLIPGVHLPNVISDISFHPRIWVQKPFFDVNLESRKNAFFSKIGKSSNFLRIRGGPDPLWFWGQLQSAVCENLCICILQYPLKDPLWAVFGCRRGSRPPLILSSTSNPVCENRCIAFSIS